MIATQQNGFFMSGTPPFFGKSDETTGDLFAKMWRARLLDAYSKRFDDVAEARFYLSMQGIDLEAVVFSLMMQETNETEFSLKDLIFSPASCGDTANGFCMLMTGRSMAAKHDKTSKSIDSLQNDMSIIFPALIRIDVPGHSYVMLCTEKKGHNIFGYIYQSNSGEGMEDNSYSLAAWLKSEKANKTNLSEHVVKLTTLIDPATQDDSKKKLYDELYCVEPIIKIERPADMNKLIQPWKKKSNIYYQIEKVNFAALLKTLTSMVAEKDAFPDKGCSLDVHIANIRESEDRPRPRL